MSDVVTQPPPIPPDPPAPPVRKALRRLYLTLFLRGRSSRGLQKGKAPQSIGSKLALSLFFYALMGLMALFFLRHTVHVMSVYLHAMTQVFLGLFLSASAGEILFNKEEGDILLHRPIKPGVLLWAKIGVMVEVSLWLAGAFNLAGLVGGVFVKDGGWMFPVVHVVSTALSALFCAGSVVLIYQLCLRWFGREKLDGLMTTAQVLVAIMAVTGGQILPRMMGRMGDQVAAAATSWWIAILPPAWFAAMDDAVAGSGATASWMLGVLGVVITATVLWLAFGKLAATYESGLQSLSEAQPARPRLPSGRGGLERLLGFAPLHWWLRDPVERASFLLCAAYLLRDRDVKLRVYPGIAPMLVLPVVFLMGGTRGGPGSGNEFGLVMAGAYLGIVPILGVSMLQYSQQWQAADLFRATPLAGPGPLCHGARRAVLFFLALPVVAIAMVLMTLISGSPAPLLMLIPGLLLMPVCSMIPCLSGGGVPLSLPTEEAKSAGRGVMMFGAMIGAAVVSGMAAFAKSFGWFWPFVGVELLLVLAVCRVLGAKIRSARWKPME
jgi:ABC-2 type transport system permease protein